MFIEFTVQHVSERMIDHLSNFSPDDLRLRTHISNVSYNKGNCVTYLIKSMANNTLK